MIRTELSLALLCGLLSCAGVAHAQSSSAEDDLLALLAEETELATRSKQNSDFVPGIVSVLQGDELRLLGARTALDALALVPGIDVARDRYGAAAIRVRGIDFFFNNGNVKVLVDGQPIAREAAFQNSVLLLMPIEQIVRIELIRGPGTGVHGDFAYLGLVNLVTRREQNEAGVALASGGGRLAHLGLSGAAASGTWRYDLSAAHWRSDRYEAPMALDNDEARSYFSGQIGRGGFSARMVALDRDYTGLAPPRGASTRPTSELQRERSYNIELRQQWERGADSRHALWLQHQSNDYTRTAQRFEGDRDELGGEWLQRYGRHQLLATLQWARLGIDEAVRPGPGGVPTSPLRDARYQYSALLQDQWQVSESLQWVVGARFDAIEGMDQQASPRLAMIWQPASRHIFKLQYAEGFRSPTFQEGFDSQGRPDAERFEHVATREAGYVFRSSRTVLRATYFITHVDDLLFPPGNPQRQRMPEIDSQGWEFELRQRLGRDWQLQANWSTANTVDGRSPAPGAPSLAQPEDTSNLGLIWEPAGQWAAGLHLQRVGRRALGGERGGTDGYDAVNLGLRWRPIAIPGLRIDLALRNALEDEIRYIEPQPGQPILRSDYSDRVWQVGASYRF
jgi:outer membrane receptor for ferrienterochelin and colicins